MPIITYIQSESCIPKAQHDATVHILKANTKLQLGIQLANLGDVMKCQAAFHQVSGLFDKALEVETNSVDALVQFVHVRTMLSLPGCREILERAQDLCRNNEEAIQICQTYGSTTPSFMARNSPKNLPSSKYIAGSFHTSNFPPFFGLALSP